MCTPLPWLGAHNRDYSVYLAFWKKLMRYGSDLVCLKNGLQIKISTVKISCI